MFPKTFKHQEVTGFKFSAPLMGVNSMCSHIYYIDNLLIDTGHSKAQSGITQQITKLPVEQIFITHHHEDHSGNIQPLQQHFNCPVYASSLCCNTMKNPPKLSWAQKLLWGNRTPVFNLQPLDNKIKTKNYTFTIIPIPGHAHDMVALYEPTKKWLFSADLYINSYISYFIDNESMFLQIQSLKKILALDFDVMFCGHNPQLTNPKQKLEKKLQFFEYFYQKVASLHAKGYQAKAIFKQMKLKEQHLIKFLSKGKLSKINMIKAAIRDIERF